jgi:predicted nuclease with TOPRIM domain
MTTKEELEQLKKQFAELEAKIANEEKQEIKTVEDAFNKLKPKWGINAPNHFTSEKESKRAQALIDLRIVAEAMNEGVESGVDIWHINYDLNVYRIIPKGMLSRLTAKFHTKELAQQALTNFKHLFEDLYAE